MFPLINTMSKLGIVAGVYLGLSLPLSAAEDGVFVRFRLLKPEGARYYVNVGGYIHEPNWVLPSKPVPSGADKAGAARVTAGEYTDWFDLKAFAGKNLHKRHNRAGGIAELPNITARFVTEPENSKRDVEIDLATAPDPAKIAKRWHETFEGDTTSFLVSPTLTADAAELETATEMSARRLRWAEDATGGTRHAPKQLLLQTSFWAPQRPELNLKEAKVLSLLGFNVVGNIPQEVRAQFSEFRAPSASHDVLLGPDADREAIGKVWEKLGAQLKKSLQPGAPFNFQDEICARPAIGTNELALRQFREWLKVHGIPSSELGVANFEQVMPIETPEVLRERMKSDERPARRSFYYTSRFRQEAATDRLIWNTEELHRRVGPNVISSTLIADHPYFGGTGLGMGMDQQNTTWGGWPLAADWFDIGRRHAVDMIGTEDWMGLQFMYGPSSTWEGFQLMGFQAAIFRSASGGKMPIMTWITPSDERNLRLKAASALAQGGKHFYFWTYGPTATSTENYWSDLPGAYSGMAHLSKMLEFAEPILAPGKPRPTRVALLYSISSDLWQPFGYIHMLERRGLYFALIHDQYSVDMLTEEDVAAGRLSDYRILYTADPCIHSNAAKAISKWVREGGTLIGTCAAGTRNQFDEPSTELVQLFGLSPEISVECQPGEYRVRGRLNEISHRDRVNLGDGEIGVIGIKASAHPAGAEVRASFASDATPALLENKVGKGRALWFTTTPGISYIKDAKFVPEKLAEKWPAAHRHALTRYVAEAGVAPLVKLSEPVVEAGIYDAPGGSALVLANFTYEQIRELRVEVPTRNPVAAVRSLEHGRINFETGPAPSPWAEAGYTYLQRFTLPLGDDDVVLMDQR